MGNFRELTEEDLDQAAGGVPSAYPGYGRYTAYTEPKTPIGGSALGDGVTAGKSGRYPSEGRATASNTPIPPGETP
jgi:hypothetical protein